VFSATEKQTGRGGETATKQNNNSDKKHKNDKERTRLWRVTPAPDNGVRGGSGYNNNNNKYISRHDECYWNYTAAGSYLAKYSARHEYCK